MRKGRLPHPRYQLQSTKNYNWNTTAHKRTQPHINASSAKQVYHTSAPNFTTTNVIYLNGLWVVCKYYSAVLYQSVSVSILAISCGQRSSSLTRRLLKHNHLVSLSDFFRSLKALLLYKRLNIKLLQLIDWLCTFSTFESHWKPLCWALLPGREDEFSVFIFAFRKQINRSSIQR